MVNCGRHLVKKSGPSTKKCKRKTRFAPIVVFDVWYIVVWRVLPCLLLWLLFFFSDSLSPWPCTRTCSPLLCCTIQQLRYQAELLAFEAQAAVSMGREVVQDFESGALLDDTLQNLRAMPVCFNMSSSVSKNRREISKSPDLSHGCELTPHVFPVCA